MNAYAAALFSEDSITTIVSVHRSLPSSGITKSIFGSSARPYSHHPSQACTRLASPETSLA